MYYSNTMTGDSGVTTIAREHVACFGAGFRSHGARAPSPPPTMQCQDQDLDVRPLCRGSSVTVSRKVQIL